jgi:hypothetical protein
VQSDGKILIGGSFTTFNGTGRNRLARLDRFRVTPTVVEVQVVDSVSGFTATAAVNLQ